MLGPDDDQVWCDDPEDDPPVARANPVVTGPVPGQRLGAGHVRPPPKSLEDFQDPSADRHGECVEVLLGVGSEENQHRCLLAYTR